MSNFVLNDDSVLCAYCYDESYGSDLRISTPYETIMGTTIHLPCAHCGEAGQQSDQEQTIC